MATNYANDKLSTAIKNHLLNVDAIPPTAELTKLAGELAQICVTELNTAGLDDKTVENLFAPTAIKAKARGVD
jgi:hypothetical protein